MVTVKEGVGVVYGKHDFDCEIMKDFIEWLKATYGFTTALSAYAPGSCEFNAIWSDLYKLAPSLINYLQERYIEESSNHG